MIIPEGTLESPSKLMQDQFPSPVGDSSTERSPNPSSPPAYPGYNTASSPQYPYHAYPASLPQTPTSPLMNKPPVTVGNPKERFFKALFAALAIYALLALVVGSIKITANLTTDSVIGYPQKSDGRIEHCVYSSSNPSLPTSQNEQISFDLPLSSDVLYVFSRGSRVRGDFQIVVDDPAVTQGMMQVDITVHYTSRDSFKSTICMLERAPGEMGVGIFAPRQKIPSGSDMGHFVVTVRLPRQLADSELFIPSFEADLPLFTMTLPELERPKSVLFGSISLKSSNEPINSGMVEASKAKIVTLNAPIIGMFCASSSLDIHTTNAPVSVTVMLRHEPSASNFTTLHMSTSNDVLTAFVALKTTNNIPLQPSDGTVSRYRITAETSDSPINVNFPYYQPYSHLDLVTTTTNGAATVQLRDSYEGTYELVTSPNSSTDVIYRSNVNDPSGQGRKRSFKPNHASESKDKTAGYVGWGSGLPVDGSVIIKTFNAQSVLILQ